MRSFQLKEWPKNPVTAKDRAKLELAEAMPGLCADDEILIIDPDTKHPLEEKHPVFCSDGVVCPFYGKDIHEVEALLRHILKPRNDGFDNLRESYIQTYLDKLRDGTHNCCGCAHLKP